jgi:hypothetical protein
VYSREFPKDFHNDHPMYKKYQCDEATSLSISDNTECWGMIKNAAVVAPLAELEVAFVHALDHIGYRTKLKGTPVLYSPTSLADRSMSDPDGSLMPGV